MEKNLGCKEEDHLQNQFIEKQEQKYNIEKKLCIDYASLGVKYFSLTIEMQVNCTFFNGNKKAN